MESENMRELLQKEFEHDPIYRLVILNKLEDKLFSEPILNLLVETTYSTVEAGKILDRPDSTIRNHFRSDLVEYIAPEKFGKFYRLNYKSIFRLHMVFLLMDLGKTTIDILAELGMHPTIQIGDDRNFNKVPKKEIVSNDDILVRLAKQEKLVNIQALMFNIISYENSISRIDRQIESEKIRLEAALSRIENKLLEEKQSIMLSTYLKDKDKAKKEKVFLGIFKKKQEDDNSAELLNQIEQIKQKYAQEMESVKTECQNEIIRLENKKKEVEAKLDNEKSKIESLRALDETRYIRELDYIE